MKTDEITVSISSLQKTYYINDCEINALTDVTLEVRKGEFVTIEGLSGAGKTSLLNLISGIDKPTKGKIIAFGKNIGAESEDSLADFRCNIVGFIFQSYNLFPTLTVAENIIFPMEWSEKSEDQIRTRVEELLKIVGLKHRTNHFPFQLSGGEKQRVAFARALANDPPLILADEPTGNLDIRTGQKIIQILEKLKIEGKTIIAVTHDKRIIQLADQRLHLENGKLVMHHE
ncbi:MAG: ABC transporter ATP-binding protein [Candidatus Bathyarchaeota archaeon]